MSDTIRVSVSFIDSGDSLDDKSVTEALPLVGQEQVTLKFSDNNENTLGTCNYMLIKLLPTQTEHKTR